MPLKPWENVIARAYQQELHGGFPNPNADRKFEEHIKQIQEVNNRSPGSLSREDRELAGALSVAAREAGGPGHRGLATSHEIAQHAKESYCEMRNIPCMTASFNAAASAQASQHQPEMGVHATQSMEPQKPSANTSYMQQRFGL